MNNNDFINALGRIDDDLLDRAARYREKGGETREQVRNARQPLYRRIGLIAACLVILLCAIPISRQVMNGFVPIGTGDETTDGYVNPDFVIEDGVLLLYTGEETEVVIPEGVIKISQAAFLSAGDITSIHLPESLEEIEPLTFADLLSLDTLTVAETNRFYEVMDYVLIKQDGTLICLQNVGSDSTTSGSTILHNAVNLLMDHGFMGSFIKSVEIGNAIMEIDDGGYNLKSITVFGERIELNSKAFPLYGNLKFQAFEVDRQYVVSSVEETQKDDGTYEGHYRTTIIVTQNEGVATISTKVSGLIEDLCSSVITFFEENGKLHYKRVPNKYFNIQVLAGELEYCVSKDELYEEIGTVYVENGNVIYYPKHKTTVSDAFDLEQEFIIWRDEVALLDSDLTLDEYLQLNSQKYSKAT